jgi:hypothetical protein
VLNNRLTGSGSCVGDPRIRAGAMIGSKGLAPISAATTAWQRDAHHRRQWLSHVLRSEEGDPSMIEEVLEAIDSSIERINKFYGVATGKVINISIR